MKYFARFILLILLAAVVALFLGSCSAKINLTEKERQVIKAQNKAWRFKSDRKESFALHILYFGGASFVTWWTSNPAKK